MTNTIRNTATAAGLAAALLTPLAASAATTTDGAPQRYTMQTRYFSPREAGEYDGLLALTVYPSGIVQGTYRDEDAGGFKTVTGGLDRRNHIWLDIGNGVRALRLYGTFENGVLTATRNAPDPEEHVFQSVSVTKRS
ncbi:MAG TPA: hypothetical protein VMA36_03845 [Candidatus Limnocylindria bacterium]|jgi:hypothetical protein|nr:hypothetical protein [Candidatus Limnocylindria bacterium]